MLALIFHSVAALCFRVLATAWSMYIIWRTVDVRSRFDILLNSDDSPCQVGVDTVDALFPSYFQSREALQVRFYQSFQDYISLLPQIPDLVMNVVSLGLALYLSMKLIKVRSSKPSPPASLTVYFRCTGPTHSTGSAHPRR